MSKSAIVALGTVVIGLTFLVMTFNDSENIADTQPVSPLSSSRTDIGQKANEPNSRLLKNSIYEK